MWRGDHVHVRGSAEPGAARRVECRGGRRRRHTTLLRPARRALPQARRRALRARTRRAGPGRDPCGQLGAVPRGVPRDPRREPGHRAPQHPAGRAGAPIRARGLRCARVLITDRDPGTLAEVVEHVVSIPDGYASLVDGADERELGLGRHERHLGGAVLHGRHDGCIEGRDALARQPHRQRVPHDGDPTLPVRRALHGDRPDVPRGRVLRRARDRLERWVPGDAAGLRPRGGGRPARARGDHRDTRGAHDARGDGGGAAGEPARRSRTFESSVTAGRRSRPTWCAARTRRSPVLA